MSEPDQDAVKRFLQGDAGGFETLVDRYQKTVYNIALRMVGNRDDAEDVTQNVFVKASENLSKFDPKYRFFSWIYRITVNESINFSQVRKRDERLPQSPDELAIEEKGPEEYAHDQHLARTVEESMARLGENERIVIILRHFQELSYEEIGYILDLPVKTVRSRLYSARQNLKEILERRMVQ